MRQITLALFFLALASAAGLSVLPGCSGPSPKLRRSAFRPVADNDLDGDADSPLKLVGERLFRETRFSEYFYSHAAENLNQLPARGDPVVEVLQTLNGPLPSPYRGQAISCANCHFVDQLRDIPGGGSRAYTDFLRRSLIPGRSDGNWQTPRNAPNMVGSAVDAGYFLHHDGEFATAEDLVRASYFGRNLGWLPGEGATATAHMARVIRADNGQFPTETDLKGLAYPKLLAGDPSIPGRFLIPAQYRLNTLAASDDEIVEGVISLVAGYMRSLDFKRDASGNYRGSPYDAFLRKNGLPMKPSAGESARGYSARLSGLLARLESPLFVGPGEGSFKLHAQQFVFGPEEFRGLRAFVGPGSCVRCHAAPDFTDHLFHNTGASQNEYDRVHGLGAFAALKVPNLSERLAQPDAYLPQSDQHPQARGVFRSAPEAGDALKADLGAWNVLGNPDMPRPQARLRSAICEAQGLDCSKLSDDEALAKSLAAIKTPTLRDLGHSNPYLHTGQMDEIEDVIRFYSEMSDLARRGGARNADPLLAQVQIGPGDEQALARFLRSLNADYE